MKNNKPVIELHFLNKYEILNNYEKVIESFTKEEAKDLIKLENPDRIIKEISSRLLINKYSGEGVLKHTDSGKPYKDNSIFFNISNSDEVSVIAVSDREVGVDIEKIRTMKNKVIKYALSEKEYESMETIDDFFKMWTIKESVGKCLGIGLTKGIKKIPTEPTKHFMGKDLTSLYTTIEGYALALTYVGFDEVEVKVFNESVNTLID